MLFIKFYLLGDNVDSQTIYTTETFHTAYPLRRIALYFNQSDYNKIEVMASLSGHPDLPQWMSYFHRPGSEMGYFYGTPAVNDDGDIDIEIILLDKYTFNITKDRLKYRIISRERTYILTLIKIYNIYLFYYRNL